MKSMTSAENARWIPERDACDDCFRCDYFLHDFWNCQGQPKHRCEEFIISRDQRMARGEMDEN